MRRIKCSSMPSGVIESRPERSGATTADPASPTKYTPYVVCFCSDYPARLFPGFITEF